MTAAQPRGMTDSITGLDDARPADLAPEELELISSGAEFREFDYDPEHNRLRVAGYTPAETGELLALYRDHLRLMHEMSIRLIQENREMQP